MARSSAVSAPKKKLSLRLAFLLGGFGTVATGLLFPYVMVLMPEVFRAARVALPVLIGAQLAQAFVVLTLLSWIGLRLGGPLGLDAPHLRAIVGGPGRRALVARSAWLAIGLGALSTVLIAGLDLGLMPLLPAPRSPQPAEVERWRGMLASFYGGIGEEIQLRLFLMSLIAWFGWRLAGRPALASPAIYWTAIAFSTLAFGAGHLPLAIKIWGSDTWVIVRTLVLNGIAGATFGWLYWRRGLEYAMLGHFVADLGLHVALPM